MNTQIQTLSHKYNLPVDFLEFFYSKVADKENFAKAVRMYANETFSFHTIVNASNAEINVALFRHHYAVALWRKRAEILKERAFGAFLDGCTHVCWPDNGNPTEMAFIHDGRVVAFGHYEPKQGGIYAHDAVGGESAFQWLPFGILRAFADHKPEFFAAIREAAPMDANVIEAYNKTHKQ